MLDNLSDTKADVKQVAMPEWAFKFLFGTHFHCHHTVLFQYAGLLLFLLPTK